MTFLLLTEDEERELHRLSRFYWKEALKCEDAKAYFSGCVMLGSALEALLMLMVNCYNDEAEATGRAPRRKGTTKPLVDWNLAQLLMVAKSAGWLPSAIDLADEWSGKKAKIGDYAEVTRLVRNLVHPGNYLKEHSHGRITAKYLQRQFEVVELCRDWLVYRNNKSLREHMRQEGLL
jgi:hypothetical protein